MKKIALCLIFLATSCGTDPVATPDLLCGNGILDIGEQCDDGNTTDGDLCNANCTVPG